MEGVICMIIYFIDGFFVIVMICALLAAIVGISGKILEFILDIFSIVKFLIIPVFVISFFFLHFIVIKHSLKKKSFIHIIILIMCDISIIASIPHILSYVDSRKLNDMNDYSLKAYNCVANYIDKRNMERFEEDYITIEDLFDGEELKKANSSDGFTIFNNIFFSKIQRCEYDISNTLYPYTRKYKLVVYVGKIQKNNKTDYYVQVRDSNEPNIIGQYPSTITLDNMNNVKWSEYLPS